MHRVRADTGAIERRAFRVKASKLKPGVLALRSIAGAAEPAQPFPPNLPHLRSRINEEGCFNKQQVTAPFRCCH